MSKYELKNEENDQFSFETPLYSVKSIWSYGMFKVWNGL